MAAITPEEQGEEKDGFLLCVLSGWLVFFFLASYVELEEWAGRI